MKLTKEENQKIVLGSLMLIGLVYGYFSFLLAPLEKDKQVLNKTIDSLPPKVTAARGQIEVAKAAERDAPKHEAFVEQVASMMPEGAPLAWFPPRLRDFFKRSGVENATVRLNHEAEDKSLGGFRKMIWGVELPKTDFIAFAAALAAMENEEPLVEVRSLQIESIREEPDSTRVTLTVQSIAKP